MLGEEVHILNLKDLSLGSKKLHISKRRKNNQLMTKKDRAKKYYEPNGKY